MLVIDEASQIAPRQILKILRLQKEMGFAVRILADREQAQAIEAGDTVEILNRVMPQEARPEILTTIRQKTAHDREIAGMFRSPGRDLRLSEIEQRDKDTGRARAAIDMKRQDGTFALIGGDHAQVVADTADFYLRRRDMLTVAGAKRGITMSAPTNDDVMALSAAVNLIDPDSKLMRRSDAHEYWQAYNAQAVVFAKGSQLILENGVVATTADAPSFAATILGMEERIGLPRTGLADTGFARRKAVETL